MGHALKRPPPLLATVLYHLERQEVEVVGLRDAPDDGMVWGLLAELDYENLYPCSPMKAFLVRKPAPYWNSSRTAKEASPSRRP